EFMHQLSRLVTPKELRLIDAPVVFGAKGAQEGNLLSLCGGEAGDVERARPVMMAYSRGVEHVGPLGAGQLAKTCNNLLHWIHCVANFETLAIAKRYGVDAPNARGPAEMPWGQRHPAQVGQHPLHLAGEGHGLRPRASPERR